MGGLGRCTGGSGRVLGGGRGFVEGVGESRRARKYFGRSGRFVGGTLSESGWHRGLWGVILGVSHDLLPLGHATKTLPGSPGRGAGQKLCKYIVVWLLSETGLWRELFFYLNLV